MLSAVVLETLELEHTTLSSLVAPIALLAHVHQRLAASQCSLMLDAYLVRDGVVLVQEDA